MKIVFECPECKTKVTAWNAVKDVELTCEKDHCFMVRIVAEGEDN